jgi:hypothetical protein
MGQYYKAVNIDKMDYMSPWGYDNGAKLMEHSYMRNNFVNTVESLLVEGGDWYKDRIVWAGDYMDDGLYINQDDKNLYEYVGLLGNEITPAEDPDFNPPNYIVNHTKMQYVDKEGCPSNYGWIIHPLPLLTSSGNERGGGDYHPYNEANRYFVGSWAGDSISIEDNIPEGYKEINPEFAENRR